MVLIMARVDPDTTRLMGRWCSDTMLCYLHTMTYIFTDGLFIHMFQYGNYVRIPHSRAYV